MTSTSTTTAAAPMRSLLLLPPAPAAPTYAALKAAYAAAILAVLSQLASAPAPARGARAVDIALPCPHLYGRLDAPRGPLYAATQRLVANLYKLVCVVAAKDAIDTEGPDRVDARLVLVAYPRDANLAQSPDDANTSDADHDAQGPAVPLRTLARSPRPWGTVFAVDTHEGERVLANFLALGKSDRNVKRVPGGGSVPTPPSPAATHPPSPTATHPLQEHAAPAPQRHSAVAVGGTFDHLHIGHKLLLTMFAFVLAPPTPHAPSTLTVGITGDQLLVNKKFPDVLESWDRRQQVVHDFLSSLIHFGPPDDHRILVESKSEPGPNGHAVHVTYPSKLTIKYVQIMDPFGPTITDESISALVISKETRSGGSAVNAKRGEKGWDPLEVFEVDVLDATEEDQVDETFQTKLSSTEIRRVLSERPSPTARA